MDGHYFITVTMDFEFSHFLTKTRSHYEITINNRFDDEVKFASIDIFVPVQHI